jgi:hypothetical protein
MTRLRDLCEHYGLTFGALDQDDFAGGEVIIPRDDLLHHRDRDGRSLTQRPGLDGGICLSRRGEVGAGVAEDEDDLSSENGGAVGYSIYSG